MGFRKDAYAKIWEIEHHERYSVARMSIGRKNRETGIYENDFQSNYVRLIGQAHEKSLEFENFEHGVTVRIKACDVTNKWDKERQKMFTDFLVFEIEIPEPYSGGGAGGGRPEAGKPQYGGGFENVPDGIDEELPFV